MMQSFLCAMVRDGIIPQYTTLLMDEPKGIERQPLDRSVDGDGSFVTE
jgi:hypothetical protein